jgi:hypothetical protein
MRTRLWDDGLDVDLHLQLGHGQPFDDEPCSYRRDAFEVFAYHIVDGLTIGAVGNVGGHFADVFQARSSFFEQHLDVLHGLLGLRQHARTWLIEIKSCLTAQKDTVAGLDHHTHIVIELLMRIDVPGVELAEAFVLHGRVHSVAHWDSTGTDFWRAARLPAESSSCAPEQVALRMPARPQRQHPAHGEN